MNFILGAAIEQPIYAWYKNVRFAERVGAARDEDGLVVKHGAKKLTN